MPTISFPSVNSGVSTDQLADLVARLTKEVQWLLNGNIDSLNIKKLTADLIVAGTILTNKVTIRADLDAGAYIVIDGTGMTVYNGTNTTLHIDLNGNITMTGTLTASVINGSEINGTAVNGGTITGSLIQTSASGIYPRIQLDSSANLLTAEYDAGSSVEIRPDAISGNPGLRFDKGLAGGTISPDTSGGDDYLKFASNPGLTYILIDAGIDLILKAFGFVTVETWSKFKNESSGQTLQQALDGKKNIGGFSGTIPPGATIFVSNGEVTGYI